MSFFNKKSSQTQVNANNNKKEVIVKSYNSSSSSSSSKTLTTTTTIKESRHHSSSSAYTSSSLIQSSENGINKSSTLPSIRGYDPVYKPVASTSAHSMLKPFGYDASLDAKPFKQYSTYVPARPTAREAFLNSEIRPPIKPTSGFTPTRPYNESTVTTKPTSLTPSNETKIKNILSSESAKYTLKGKEQGYAVIFNHEDFQDKSMKRLGTNNDEKELKRVFETFKFSVTVRRNYKLKEIESEIASLRKRNFSKNSCLVIIILSHGDEYESISAYDSCYSLQTTMVEELIKNDTLLGKPKIFIINACKGNIKPATVKLKHDSVPFVPKPKQINTTRETEILKIYSTFEKRVSYRDEETGSIFIQALCTKLLAKGYDTPIDDILREVRREITEKGLNQTPSETSSMTKEFCFGDALKRL